MLFVLLFSPYFRYLPLDTVLQKSITARLDGIVNPSIHIQSSCSRMLTRSLDFITRNIIHIIPNLIIGVYATKCTRYNIRRKTIRRRIHLFTIIIHNRSHFHLLDIFSGLIQASPILIMFGINMECPVFKTMTRSVHTSPTRMYLYLN